MDNSISLIVKLLMDIHEKKKRQFPEHEYQASSVSHNNTAIASEDDHRITDHNRSWAPTEYHWNRIGTQLYDNSQLL